jgi:hypothetical protein
MKEVLQTKYKASEKFRNYLKSTGNATLEENTSHPFWAMGRDRNGQNHLGQLLMSLRNTMTKDIEENSEGQVAPNLHPVTKKVILLGNSHTAKIPLSRIGSRNVWVQRFNAMTVEKAREEIQTAEKADAAVLHLITNEVSALGDDSDEVHAAQLVTDEMDSLVKLAKSKAATVIISAGLPRDDNSRRSNITKLININLQVLYGRDKRVHIIINDSLSFCSGPGNELYKDGTHLNDRGTDTFARNLRAGIHYYLGVDEPPYARRPKFNESNTAHPPQHTYSRRRRPQWRSHYNDSQWPYQDGYWKP